MSFTDKFNKAIREWLIEQGVPLDRNERVKAIDDHPDCTCIIVKNRETKQSRVIVRPETIADIVSQGRIGLRM